MEIQDTTTHINENSIILTPENISKEIKLGFEWLCVDGEHEEIEFDVFLWAILVSRDGRISRNTDLVFYNNWSDSEHIVYFDDDNDYMQEDSISINLNNATIDTEKIIIFVSLYNAVERNQNFSQLAAIRLHSNVEIGKRTLVEFDNLPPSSVLLLCEIRRSKNEWVFSPTGIGYSGDLIQFLKDYGVNL